MAIDYGLIWYHFYQIGIAFILALPIALNREYKGSGAGMRTYPLVSIACCAFMLVAMDMFESGDPQAKVMYGIITGMGFIGGGAIINKIIASMAPPALQGYGSLAQLVFRWPPPAMKSPLSCL